MAKREKTSLGKYYLGNFANGIKKITNSTPMVSIVNAFIAMMPVIIAASIFTLLSALPEMIIKVTDQALSTTEGWAKWLELHPAFGQYQSWANIISNWSMGLLGMFVTAMIAKNMGEQLNNKLPMTRKINLNVLFVAAISCYIMLSVIEFTVSENLEWAMNHTGRAIFVDGLAAQGILPGIIIGLTLPYVFYFAYKMNLTIRLPKQVPQTISQAFLAVIPLFLALGIFGSLAFGLEKVCGQPVLFWMFSKIQEGFTKNPKINDSYGLIAAYSIMESGFWFLGVHPEPVHAVMRATFWFQNVAEGGHIFTEPLMYGFGAMGGSGTTLMVPMLCLLMCHSTKMRVTGKTSALPIVFQVNEPCLFGVPLILNPIFAVPFLFTGLANNMLFAFIAKTTSFVGGTLNLPWSTPYFLQTTLGTPTQWQPWLWCIGSLIIATLLYAPFVKIQDNIYLKEEIENLGLEAVNFHPVSWGDIIIRQLFKIDPIARREFKAWKKSFRIEFKEFKEELINNLYEFKNQNLHLTEIANLKQLHKKQLLEAYKTKTKDEIIKLKKLQSETLKSLIAKYPLTKDLKHQIATIKSENKAKIANKKQELKTRYNTQLFEQKYLYIAHTFTNLVNFYLERVNSKQHSLNTKEKNLISKYEKQIEDKKKRAIKPVEKYEARIDAWNQKIETLKQINETSEAESFTKKVSQIKINVLLAKIENTKRIIESYKNKTVSVKWSANTEQSLAQILNALEKQQGFDVVKLDVKCLDQSPEVYVEKRVLAYKRKMDIQIYKTMVSYKKKYTRLLKINSKKELGQKALELPLFVECCQKYTSIKDINERYWKEVYIKTTTSWKEIYSKQSKSLLKGISPWTTQTLSVKQELSKNDMSPKTDMLDREKHYSVLVLCLGAGSSAVLANKISEGLKAAGYPNIESNALAWGSHESALNSADLVILSPQLGLHLKNLTVQAKEKGFILHACRGLEYINLSKDAERAANFVIGKLKEKN